MTELSHADRLTRDADAAARVRRLSTHPDVIALRVEKVRTQVDTALWAALLLALGFTMVNVQGFAAAGAPTWSLPWLAAWLLDPLVSLALVAVLRAEQITARYQVDAGPWAHRTKLLAFAATYTMNTWQSWAALNAAGIVLHSVPPLMVFAVAETGPTLRDRLTEAVMRAEHEARARSAAAVFAATPQAAAATRAATPAVTWPAANGHAATPTAANTPAPRPAAGVAAATDLPQPTRPVAPAASDPTAGRGRADDVLAAARAAWTPDTAVTPAWVRSVCPGVARTTSAKVATRLRDEVAARPAAEPAANGPAIGAVTA